MPAYNLLTILGPTACGKTALAVHAALDLNGEIISADSRQVYRNMDIGTGKDLQEYSLQGKIIPMHLIDIADAGYHYNVYEFQRDFVTAFSGITERGAFPVLCGGTGLYLEAALKGYRMEEVPENPILRKQLSNKTLSELTEILQQYKSLHNHTDTDTAKRAIRAIEIAEYYQHHPTKEKTGYLEIRPLIIGLLIDREERRHRISLRLKQRLKEGLVEEVQSLLNRGLSADSLIYYGLEYKYVTLFLTGKLTYQQMETQLEIAIHQFAKRQMTWFRGMERRGIPIQWIDALLPLEKKRSLLVKLITDSMK
ncbi:tRNA (adenosine(37)-N6)-dimethylallyltransferase MiaA [Microbacter margulisiae]|uniref:tRNA dimethylallyltransferase n=1 Tax=Microbacter margulisiae TaxID=1350067 RepID=A0A7W5H104_9PORP|nr:tRNA (adenosine(37)-N6)-dimethylallyltransferase MiaA [Microbacter margulisiae]MBB3185852.1 tRNA dimethylallyltransferase [Microbacter margulisiae]